MSPIFLVGIIITIGFLFGEIAKKIGLPKVTGYILAGVFLNPSLFSFIPKEIVSHSKTVTNMALSFITFSVGGTLLISKIKKTGKSLLSITFFEAEFAFIFIVLGFVFVAPFILHGQHYNLLKVIVPTALLLGSIGAPTDPSATLAVQHQYNAKGEVSNAMMEVAAFDDALGIINFSIAIVIAQIFVTDAEFSVYNSFLSPLLTILGSLVLGIVFGLIFNIISKLIQRETEGALIVLIMASLFICYGLAGILKVDELFAIMTFGAIVVNFNPNREQIFNMLQRYTDELVFVVFFTLSGMFLDISVLPKCIGLIFLFVIFRILGKISGTMFGSYVGNASSNVKKFTAGGLIPQGGIVVGLALKASQMPVFSEISSVVINVIIGSTIIFEFIGPILAKNFLIWAGEIDKK